MPGGGVQLNPGRDERLRLKDDDEMIVPTTCELPVARPFHRRPPADPSAPVQYKDERNALFRKAIGIPKSSKHSPTRASTKCRP